MKIRAHTCFIGKSGYCAHARSFFKELSKHVDLKIRNFTWDDDTSYLTDSDFRLLETITLSDNNGTLKDYPASHVFPKSHNNNLDFYPDVDIVLMESDHHYFYSDLTAKIKIAYTVWESTILPPQFFERLLYYFDYVWVVTEWHKNCLIKQGFPPHRIFIVHEGIDPIFFESETRIIPEKFRFLMFTRWDYRKSVVEIIRAFLQTFPNNEPVELLLSADNPFAVDGMISTEERLVHYGLEDPRIVTKHFVNRNEYVSLIKNGNVLLSCARSEGWNIPLAEAMAYGIPSIYSNWGAQLEFAQQHSNKVAISEERLASNGIKTGWVQDVHGNYAEPDFNDLKRVIRDCYDNYDKKYLEAQKDKIHLEKFTWEAAASSAMNILNSFENTSSEKNKGVVIILSHADTEEKKKLLRDNIFEMKRQGMTIIVSSHIPIDEELTRFVDFIVYDKENALIYEQEYKLLKSDGYKYPVFYMNWPTWSLTYAYDLDHGYAILRLLKNAIGICSTNDFKIIHIVNYDFIINDPAIFTDHNYVLENMNYDIYAYRHSDYKEQGSINTGIFSCKTNLLHAALSSFKSKHDYYRYPDASIFEEQFTEIVLEADMKIFMKSEDDLSKCTINAYVIPSNPGVSKKDCYCFLTNDGTDSYIFLKGYREPFKAEISAGSTRMIVDVTIDTPIFVKITSDHLADGIQISIKDFSFIKLFDRSSKRAECSIHDNSLIQELKEKENEYLFSFKDGVRVDICGDLSETYTISFIDSNTDFVHYETTINNNCWASCNIKYFVPWRIEILSHSTGKIHVEILDLTNKKVYFSIESRSLGDNIAWFPHIDEFCKKHKCQCIVSTFKNDLFEKAYPDLKFVSPGEIIYDIYVHYRIGWFYNENDIDRNMNPVDFRLRPMQAASSDILGLQYAQIKPKIAISNSFSRKNKYVCIANHSTAQAKYWNNPSGWQELVNWFKVNGYDVINLSIEEDGYMGNKNPIGTIKPVGERTLENTIGYLQNAEMFIGIGSGLSWLSWALNIPTVIISGFSKSYTEPEDENVLRITNLFSCNGCFNKHRLDADDWNWCPEHKNTHRQFECSRSITAKHVIDKIRKFKKKNVSVNKVLEESYSLGMKQNYTEIFEAVNFFKNLDASSFIEIGTDQGGTFAAWSKCSNNGIKISVDLPHGQFGVNTYDVEKRDNYLKSLGINVHMIHGSSHDEDTRKKVETLLNDEKVDFLFIDGDHSYEGVKNDYEHYKKYVKSGGWIGFHDIKNTEFHRTSGCRVDKLWNELEGIKVEFVDPLSNFGGIGFVYNH